MNETRLIVRSEVLTRLAAYITDGEIDIEDIMIDLVCIVKGYKEGQTNNLRATFLNKMGDVWDEVSLVRGLQ